MSLFGKSDAKARKPKVLTSQERANLVQETHWEERDIKTLHAMFVRNSNGSDTIPVERLCDLPETSTVPLFHRVLTYHNVDNSGLVSFSEFARAMSALSPNATLDEKLQFAFKLFDMNDSGDVAGSEIFQLLRMALGSSHGDAQLQAIVDQVMSQHPEGMTLDDFAELIDASDLSRLTISL
jgi:serine/threonine-protein phosphatase 2B regulatory subunit